MSLFKSSLFVKGVLYGIGFCIGFLLISIGIYILRKEYRKNRGSLLELPNNQSDYAIMNDINQIEL